MDPFASGVRVAPTTTVPDQKVVETSSAKTSLSETRATLPLDEPRVRVFA